MVVRLTMELDRSLDQGLKPTILNRAMRRGRRPEIHHSDQGVHFAATAYTDLLAGCGVAISMAAGGVGSEGAPANADYGLPYPALTPPSTCVRRRLSHQTQSVPSRPVPIPVVRSNGQFDWPGIPITNSSADWYWRTAPR
jgi:hypothetical protein